MSSEIRFPKSAQRTPCVLVLDASGSMEEESTPGRTRIDELNAGIQILQRDLMADSTARTRIELCIVCVGGPAGDADLLMDWTDVPSFMPPPLSAGGMTPLGEGVRIALSQVEERKRYYKNNGYSYTRPWIIVVSDGEPTDNPADWQSACQSALDAINSKKALIFPVGVDGDANLHVLSQLSDKPALGMNAVNFQEFFQWVSSSLGSVASSRPGEGIQLAPVNAWATVSA
jgi:uncharacterized protein YegL